MTGRINMRFVPHRFVVAGTEPDPTDFIQEGELISNTADGKLFLLMQDGQVRKFEPPNLSGYATTQQLNSAIAGVSAPDLSPYALKTELPNLMPYATTQQLNSAIAGVSAPDLSPYARMADLGTLLQIYKGVQDPRNIQSLTVNPGFTWIEVDSNGGPIMTWQYTMLSGVGKWVSTYLDRLGGYTGGISGTSNIFSSNDYALPYDLLPCYASGKAQNQNIARPGGIGGTTDSSVNYWDLSLRVFPEQNPGIEVAFFSTKDVDWAETGLNLYVQIPCTPYILNTAGLGGTKNPRTFVLRATKSGGGNVTLIQFVWSMTFRYVRR